MPLSSVVGAQSIVRPGVCTSSTKPASPYDGQVIYMTDVDQTAVWDGSAWVVLAPIASGRNVVINGAMQVAQRGTSTAGITSPGYYTVDRFEFQPVTIGTWTMSVENDAPDGSGFRNSAKVLCTTADASPAAGDSLLINQRIEGQNVQQFLKGSASAKQFALTFWVKGNVTGTYIVELRDADNSRIVCGSYTVAASGTWEKKSITFPADTTGVLDNDNALSLSLIFWLAAGTNYSSGTLNTTSWAASNNTNRAVGQTNLASATNNYWQITGVQLEAGSVATPFEFEDYGTTLAKCQRYYQKSYNLDVYAGTNTAVGLRYAFLGSFTGNQGGTIVFSTCMRATPTVTAYSNIGTINKMGTDGGAGEVTANIITEGQGSFTTYYGGGGSAGLAGYLHFVASAEL